MQIEANFVDIEEREIYPVRVVVSEGKIVSIERIDTPCEHYLLPGFIDAHIHIESSMLPPSEFARLAVCHGTVATVSDPHEIANVLGIEGVKYMLESAEEVDFKFYFGASPCVPATPFETSGATLGPDEIETLLKMPQIKYLSEVMNFPGVIAGDKDMLAKIAIARRLGKRIDGHAPGLRGEDLTKYIAAGIETDHEAFSYEEGLEKIEKGMKILIREGSAAKNFDALAPLIAEYPEKLMFCSDDRHPNDLAREHIDGHVRRSIARGYDLFDVLRIACLNPVEHYGLEVGRLRIDDPADFIIVEDLKSFRVIETVIRGRVQAKEGKPLFGSVKKKTPNNFHAARKIAADFSTQLCDHAEVIHALDHQLITQEEIVDFPSERPEILRLTVVNRYEAKAAPSVAWVDGFGLKKGAIASSVAHDSHNILATGCSDELISKAVNAIIGQKGGICAVDEEHIWLLPLPIAGLMSDEEGFDVAARYAEIDRIVREEFASPLSAPFMTLSFMALLVIPELKLSDKGLFDGRGFHFIDTCRRGV
jgi:adenine deaminase